MVTNGDSIGIIPTGTQNVNLNSAIHLTVFFTMDAGKNIDDYSFQLTYPVSGTTATKPLSAVYDSANSRYYVNIEDIPAAYMDNDYKITVTNAEGSYEMTTNILVYLTNLLAKSTDENQKNVAKAMYLYGQAASTYFGK